MIRFTRITITSPVVLLGSLVASFGPPGAKVVTVVASFEARWLASIRPSSAFIGDAGPMSRRPRSWSARYRPRPPAARAAAGPPGPAQAARSA